ncbi:MAG: hypothetical protein ACE5WD_09375 [Candidatus Aminicenantia bacterium]
MEIKVKCYSGYKGNETPKAIIIDDQEEEIKEIIRRERVEDLKTGEREDVFWCKMENKIIKLVKSRKTGRWRIK